MLKKTMSFHFPLSACYSISLQPPVMHAEPEELVATLKPHKSFTVQPPSQFPRAVLKLHPPEYFLTFLTVPKNVGSDYHAKLTFTERCCWGLRPSRTMADPLHILILRSFETSENTNPATQCRIPREPESPAIAFRSDNTNKREIEVQSPSPYTDLLWPHYSLGQCFPNLGKSGFSLGNDTPRNKQ
jgi:hypothetical protein